MRRLLHIPAHLAVWAGLYVAGAVVCVSQVAGLDAGVATGERVRVAGFAMYTAMAVYLLDRVKLRDAWLDPADAIAHPARFQFLARHARAVRVWMVVLLGVATWLGAGLTGAGAGDGAWGAAVPIVAAAGVVVYAGKPRGVRPRPKDVVLVKNAYVAMGITGFAAMLALVAATGGGSVREVWNVARAHGVALGLSGVHLAARVFADAALCDLDDEESDRQHGTGTLPTYLGRVRAWNTAMGVRLVMAAAIAMMTALPWRARIAWATVTAVSSVALRVAAPARVRDWVDVRLALEAAVVTVVLCWIA